MILLENEELKATFEMKGAELKSLVNKKTTLAYLWDSNPDYWAKSSPVLFPIVGSLKDDTYRYNGKAYHLPRHGFARDMDFDMLQSGTEEVCFSLQSTEASKNVYPFDFKLNIRYTLHGATLRCAYEVVNTGEGKMLFSIGAHPAFKVPLTENSGYERYYLQFNRDEQLTVHKIAGNLIDDTTDTLKLPDGQLPLRHALFVDDALVIKDLKSNEISILNLDDEHGIKFRFNNFPYFGIWAAANADFVCLEPWCGIADSVQHDGDFAAKEGIMTLAEGATWEKSWEVSCF